MKLKTKDGKYFSELGSWGSLTTAIIAVIVFKIVQLGFLNLWTGTAIFVIVAGVFFLDKEKWLRIFRQKSRDGSQKVFHFIIKNWFSVILVILAVFAIYWFGIRPVVIRKNCAVIKWVEPATPAQPASSNWPQCESIKTNPFDCISNKYDLNKNKISDESSCNEQEVCSQPIPAHPEIHKERRANDGEYKICLRENGI